MEKKTTSFKENINICRCLRNREVGSRNRKRKDFYMLKNLICLSSRKYQVVSCKKSNYTFSYESGRLFSDNYRVCHYGYGLNGGMKKMYELPKGQLYTRNKVEDALIYSCYHDKFNKYDNIPCMVALTCKLRELGERIVQYNLNTGQVIRDICLPQAIKFKYLAWAEPNEMFYVKSVHSVDRSRFHIRAGLSLHVAVVIAIFSAFPLRYIGMFEVDRRVFGAGITNAIITNSLLVVMYITGHVKFFSLENILQTYKTFDCDIEDCCTEPFCEHPCPLQLNIKITECPPVLLDVKCADQNVQIGGYPWHYISTPRGMMGLFEITALDNHVMVESGELKADFVHPETDSCCFHGDGSGRIMFITKNIVKIYNLVFNEDTGTRSLQSLTSIDIKHDQQKVERIQITSSGRCIRRRQSMDEVSLDDSINIQQLEYEDELDLTWISISETGIPYHVCFYDNLSLQELRNISLENSEVADECYEQQIYVDLDTIVLVTKPRLGQFICTVYRLSGDLNQVDQSATTSKLESSSKSKDNSASNRRRGLRTRTR